jgi:hypothetical protein
MDSKNVVVCDNGTGVSVDENELFFYFILFVLLWFFSQTYLFVVG